jgi:uncharacterized protein (TIGR04222 family)
MFPSGGCTGWKAALLGAVAAAVVLASGASGTEPGQDAPAAQERSYGITSFHVQLDLDGEGVLRVQEEIVFRFQGGTFSPGFRMIPRAGLDGIDSVRVWSPDTEVTGVTDRRRGRYHEVEWSIPPRSEPATFVISYVVHGSLSSAEGENLLRWNAVGDEWDVPMEDVRVRVTWPSLDLAPEEVRIAPEDRSTLEAGDEGWTAIFAPGSVPANTTYQVAVRFPERIAVPEPPMPADRGREVLAFLGLFLLGLIPGLKVLWSDRSAPTPPMRFEPEAPEVSIPHGGLLAYGGMYWRMRVLPAVLVNLARRGQVTLRRIREEKEDRKWWDTEEAEERLEVEAHPDPGGLSSFEEQLLVELEEHDSFQEFVAKGGGFRSQALGRVRDDLVKQGLLEDLSDRSNRLLVTAGLVALAAGAMVVLGSGAVAAWTAALGLGGTLGFLLAALRRSRRTSEGAQVRARVRTFHDGVRKGIESAWDRDPERAGQVLTRHLEWVLLDPKVSSLWMGRLKKKLETAEVDLGLPDWLIQTVGVQDEEALAGFLTFQYLFASTQPTGTTTAGTGSFSSGVGASGGVGGGGGGMR